MAKPPALSGLSITNRPTPGEVASAWSCRPDERGAMGMEEVALRGGGVGEKTEATSNRSRSRHQRKKLVLPNWS
jgi:hypothetical protein